MLKRRMAAAVAAAMFVVGLAGAARAQGRAGGVPPEDAAVSPVELQRMFDAYAIVQAQEFLKLGDEQYVKFLPRFRACWMRGVRHCNSERASSTSYAAC